MQELELVLEERPSGDGQQRLRSLVRQAPEPRSAATGEDADGRERQLRRASARTGCPPALSGSRSNPSSVSITNIGRRLTSS
jgi:hypothetical protein